MYVCYTCSEVHQQHLQVDMRTYSIHTYYIHTFNIRTYMSRYNGSLCVSHLGRQVKEAQLVASCYTHVCQPLESILKRKSLHLPPHQHTLAYVSIRQQFCQHTSLDISIRQHTSLNAHISTVNFARDLEILKLIYSSFRSYRLQSTRR